MYVKMGSEYLQIRIHILIVNIEYVIKYKEVIKTNKDSFWMMTSSFVFWPQLFLYNFLNIKQFTVIQIVIM